MTDIKAWLPRPTGWVFSAKADFLLFIFPLLIGWVFLYFLEMTDFGPSHLFNIGGTHVYARITWIDWLFTALIDAPHVLSTGYRIFSDPQQIRKQSFLYAYLPVLVILTLIFSFHMSEFWTFRLISYLNIYHLIKQQYGWIRYSEIKSNITEKISKKILAVMIYNFTLVPILMWHFNPNSQSRVGWIFQGDLMVYPSPLIYTVLMSLHWFLNIFFAITFLTHLRKGYQISVGQLVILFSTWLAWYGGIVLKIGGDETFLIDILHVTPYLGLTYFVYKKQFSEVKKTKFFKFYLPLAALGLGSTYIYSFYTTQDASSWGLVALGCLSGISVTHYLLDGFIWRINETNPAVKRWLYR